VQPVVCLALRREQLAGFADDLFKHWHSESGPQALAIGIAHPPLFRPPQNDDCMR